MSTWHLIQLGAIAGISGALTTAAVDDLRLRLRAWRLDRKIAREAAQR